MNAKNLYSCVIVTPFIGAKMKFTTLIDRLQNYDYPDTELIDSYYTLEASCVLWTYFHDEEYMIPERPVRLFFDVCSRNQFNAEIKPYIYSCCHHASMAVKAINYDDKKLKAVK